MNMEEFLAPKATAEEIKTEAKTTEEIIDETEELDVQKAVVESLAAEKVEQDEFISRLNQEKSAMEAEISQLKSKLSSAEDEIKRLKEELVQAGERLSANTESPLSSQVALLDREESLDERFPGEMRDHVLEVIKDARDQAEKDGRFRRAQLLEAVLVGNQPSGELDIRRKAVNKIFSENQNVINGTVISELEKLGLSHKNGENYLLPSEIVARNF